MADLIVYVDQSLDLSPNITDPSNEVKRLKLLMGELRRGGLKYKIIPKPWARIIRDASLKDNVLIYGMSKTNERENDYNWLFQIQNVSVNLFGLKSLAEENLSKETILNSNYKALCEIGTAECFFLEYYGFPNSQIIKTPSSNNPAHLEEMILRKRASFSIGIDADVKNNLKLLGQPQDTIIPVAKITDIGIYLAAPKSLRSDLLNRLKVINNNDKTLLIAGDHWCPYNCDEGEENIGILTEVVIEEGVFII